MTPTGQEFEKVGISIINKKEEVVMCALKDGKFFQKQKENVNNMRTLQDFNNYDYYQYATPEQKRELDNARTGFTKLSIAKKIRLAHIENIEALFPSNKSVALKMCTVEEHKIDTHNYYSRRFSHIAGALFVAGAVCIGQKTINSVAQAVS